MTDDDLTDHDAAAIASFFEAQASGKSPAEWLKDEIAKMPPRPEPTLADRLGRLVELQAELGERFGGAREVAGLDATSRRSPRPSCSQTSTKR